MMPRRTPPRSAGRFPRRILVAYVGTSQADAALDVAIELARGEESTVVACFAMDVATEMGRLAAGFRYAPASAKRILHEDAEAILARAASRAQKLGWTIETRFLDGPAIASIVAFARKTHANAIVIGSHGRRGLPRIILGSVAEGVMRRAGVPVLVVRAPRGRARKPARKTSR